MSVYSIPTPTNPAGWSKYLKSVFEGLVSAVNSKFDSVDSLVASNKASVDADVVAEATARQDADNALQANIDAEEARAVAAEQALAALANQQITFAAADRAAIRSEVSASVANLTSGIDALEAWRVANTDEITKEVDKAINEKVSQTAYDAVVAQLQSKDSDLTASLSQAITDRENKDAEHTGKLAKLEAFVALLLSTYHLQDADGTVVSSVDDIVV